MSSKQATSNLFEKLTDPPSLGSHILAPNIYIDNRVIIATRDHPRELIVYDLDQQTVKSKYPIPNHYQVLFRPYLNPDENIIYLFAARPQLTSFDITKNKWKSIDKTYIDIKKPDKI